MYQSASVSGRALRRSWSSPPPSASPFPPFLLLPILSNSISSSGSKSAIDMSDLYSKEIEELLQTDSEDELVPAEPYGNEDTLSNYKLMMDIFEMLSDHNGVGTETEDEKQSREEHKERYQKYKQLYGNLKSKLDTIKERRLAYDNRKKEEKRKQKKMAKKAHRK